MFFVADAADRPEPAKGVDGAIKMSSVGFLREGDGGALPEAERPQIADCRMGMGDRNCPEDTPRAVRHSEIADLQSALCNLKAPRM
jgi:hypothetical protein